MNLGQWTVSQREVIKALDWWAKNHSSPAKITVIARKAAVVHAYVSELLPVLEKFEYVTVLRTKAGATKRKGCIIVNFEKHDNGIPIDDRDRDYIQLLKEYEGG